MLDVFHQQQKSHRMIVSVGMAQYYLIYSETCLTWTLNKSEFCINQTLNKVPMKEIFVNSNSCWFWTQNLIWRWFRLDRLQCTRWKVLKLEYKYPKLFSITHDNTVKLVLRGYLWDDIKWSYKTCDFLKELNLYETVYERTRKRWPFNTGDCSLEVMACAGLTVYLTFVQAPGSGYDYNISVIGR
jgi:hypothetical protein